MDDGSEGTFYDWNALERMEQFGHRRPSSDARTEVVVSPDLSHANDVAAEEAESEPDAMPPLWNPFDEPAGEYDRIQDEPLWICRSCLSPDWRTAFGFYRCSRCGSDKFTRADLQVPGQAVNGFGNGSHNPAPQPGGNWVFIPHDGGKGSPPYVPRQMPDDPGPSFPTPGASETAESEALTMDPVIDPVTLQPVHLSRRQRRTLRQKKDKQRAQSVVDHDASALDPSTFSKVPRQSSRNMTSQAAGTSHAGSDPRAVSQWRDKMLSNLSNVVDRKKSDEWTVQKGPAPGVKYRSGAPPAPPSWNYGKDDLRAFQKWTRKLEVWRIQIAAYLPPNEAAMLLYVSLRGEAEEELEWCATLAASTMRRASTSSSTPCVSH